MQLAGPAGHCEEDMTNPKVSTPLSIPGHSGAPRTLSAYPTVTGASVMGICYDGGVVVAADIGAYFGKTLRFENCPRIRKVNQFTLMAVSGDYADFQYLEKLTEAKVIDEDRYHDGFQLKPKSLHSWLSRVLYNRRNKFDPLWTNIIVAGMQDGKPYLGYVDKLGSAFETHVYATGFGTYLGLGHLAEAYEKKKGKLSKQEAIEVVKGVLRVLYYRDTMSHPKFQIAVCSAEGISIEGPFMIDSDWLCATLSGTY